MFGKVLVANRGEIAVRIIRTLREMGLRSLAVYSDADRLSLHTRMADEAAHIGPSPAAESYLSIDRIVEAARTHGAEAVHPGYGFLSENPEFAAACERAGLVFIGPQASAIRLMGSKTEARALAESAGVPLTPGTGALADFGQAREAARSLGYPVMLKAVGGGGGKGMRRVDREQDVEAAFREASSEAARAFANPEVYLEKLIENPRHIEIQVIADAHGNLCHLGERECSLQRRHQKVVEECPSPLVARHPEMRQAMGEAAVRLAAAAGYRNAGTLEFLATDGCQFYFLEMNTRLQVEHPVTEMVTGLDLVRLQVEIAAGARLPFTQQDVRWHGAAIECRIYAEDPENGFLPSPGRITVVAKPEGPGVRVDGYEYAGWDVPLDYDPLLSKLVVWAASRPAAIARMQRALSEYHLGGIRTNLGFFRELLQDERFLSGRLHTGLIADFLSRRRPEAPPELAEIAALAAALDRAPSKPPQPAPAGGSPWKAEGRELLLR